MVAALPVDNIGIIRSYQMGFAFRWKLCGAQGCSANIMLVCFDHEKFQVQIYVISVLGNHLLL